VCNRAYGCRTYASRSTFATAAATSFNPAPCPYRACTPLPAWPTIADRAASADFKTLLTFAGNCLRPTRVYMLLRWIAPSNSSCRSITGRRSPIAIPGMTQALPTPRERLSL
jgi:hypothetical protein